MNPLTQFKKILILPLLVALTFVALASPPVARADAVTDWNLIASNAIVVTAGQPPPVSVLHFAMVQGAVYDAVNAIDRGHRPYLVQPDAVAQQSFSYRQFESCDVAFARKSTNRTAKLSCSPRGEREAHGVVVESVPGNSR